MRYGINSLAGLVRNELHFDPMGGEVFVFLGKRMNQVRLLQWDHDGFAMYIKKLEKGTFEWPKGDNILISNHQLTLLSGGNAGIGAFEEPLDKLKKGVKITAFL